MKHVNASKLISKRITNSFIETETNRYNSLENAFKNSFTVKSEELKRDGESVANENKNCERENIRKQKRNIPEE